MILPAWPLTFTKHIPLLTRAWMIPSISQEALGHHLGVALSFPALAMWDSLLRVSKQIKINIGPLKPFYIGGHLHQRRGEGPGWDKQSCLETKHRYKLKHSLEAIECRSVEWETRCLPSKSLQKIKEIISYGSKVRKERKCRKHKTRW